MSARIREEQPDDREAWLVVERAAFEDGEEAAVVAAVRDEEGSFADRLVPDPSGSRAGARAW